MKKFAVFLATAALLVLTACGTTSGTTSMTPESAILGNESGAGAGGGNDMSSSVESTPTPNNPSDRTVRVGLGLVASNEESQPANGDQSGRVHFMAAVCALALGPGDVIESVRFDTMQSEVGFDLTGAFLGDITTPIQTKRELGDAYGLGAASGIGKEWYEQMDALERWMTGKTVDEVLGMQVTQRDATHTHVPDVEELRASVTISVTDQLRALEKAYNDAK